MILDYLVGPDIIPQSFFARERQEESASVKKPLRQQKQRLEKCTLQMEERATS